MGARPQHAPLDVAGLELSPFQDVGSATELKFEHCVLHIGMEKTGTTTLQRTLGMNRQLLLDHGYFVPSTLAPHAGEGYLNHIALMTYALDPANLSEGFRVAAGMRDAASVSAHRETVGRELEAEIRRDAGGCTTMILSNEHCQSRLRRKMELTALRDLLLRFCETVSVVLYLRPQHEVATALYGTAQRLGFTNIPLLPVVNGDGEVVPDMVDPMYFRYDLLVERWADVFGRDRMDVRISDATSMIDGDLVPDFLTRLGLDPSSYARPASHENTSFTAGAAVVLTAINQRLAQRKPADPATVRQRLVDTLQVTRRGSGIRPSRAQASAFFGAFKDINERVRKEYFPDRKQLFSPDFSSYPPRTPSMKPEVDDVIDILLDVLCGK